MSSGLDVPLQGRGLDPKQELPPNPHSQAAETQQPQTRSSRHLTCEPGDPGITAAQKGSFPGTDLPHAETQEPYGPPGKDSKKEYQGVKCKLDLVILLLSTFLWLLTAHQEQLQSPAIGL